MPPKGNPDIYIYIIYLRVKSRCTHKVRMSYGALSDKFFLCTSFFTGLGSHFWYFPLHQ